MSRLRCKLLCLVLALLAGSAAGAAEPTPDRIIAYRQAVYGVIRWNWVPMSEMVRDQRPYDAAGFARRARRVAFLVQQLEEGYAKGSDQGAVTDASPEIWTHWDDFSSRLAELRREARALRTVAADGELDAIKEQFAKTGAVCKGCHDRYKLD